MPHPVPLLYLISDRKVAGGTPALLDILQRVAAAMPPGALAVQIREKDLAPREVIALARAAVRSLSPWNVPVLVNDRFDLARAAGAAGVHLASSGLAPGEVRLACEGVIAVSTHSITEVAGLRPSDVDFAVFGPVFDTPSKRPYGPPQGIPALRQAAESSAVPVVALGGIRPDNAGSLKGTGAAGVAVISAVLAAADPVAAALALAGTFDPTGC